MKDDMITINLPKDVLKTLSNSGLLEFKDKYTSSEISKAILEAVNDNYSRSKNYGYLYSCNIKLLSNEYEMPSSGRVFYDYANDELPVFTALTNDFKTFAIYPDDCYVELVENLSYDDLKRDFDLTELDTAKIKKAINLDDFDIDENGVLIKYHGCEENVVIPNNVTSIGKRAFDGCESLINITIPNSVTSIGTSAFAWCENLESINISDSVTSISNWAFFNCTSLTSITISDSITSIGTSAFEWCESLESINIPDNVKCIDKNAFENCYNLVINCYKGSYAEQYAKEYRIPYDIIEAGKAKDTIDKNF